MPHVLALLALLALVGSEPAAPVAYRIGGPLREALGGRMTASWKNVPRRDVLRRIAETRRVAILLDRRIDPSVTVDLDASRQPTRAVLDRLAREAGAATALVSNTVYVAPPAHAALLEVLVRQRAGEFSWFVPKLPFDRQRDLTRRRTIHWNDLDTPADIISRIAAEFGFAVEGIELVPHDLWAGWTLPESSAAEALSLVLIQFDLTFAWHEDGTGFRIVPVPPDTRVEAEYTIGDAPALAARLKADYPQLAAAVRGRVLSVRGPFDALAAAMPLIAPARIDAPLTDEPGEGGAPLSRRRFTLRIENVPASALMRRLEESGIAFEYDSAALAAAGIDLNMPIRMDVNQATAEEFFRAMFEPLGVGVAMDGTTVRLAPM